MPGGDEHAVRAPTSPTISTEPATKTSSKRHPLLFSAEDELEAGRPTKEGYLRPKRQLFPDVFVSRETLKRALSLTSRLYNELEARGGDVRIAAKDSALLGCALDHRVDRTERTMENSGPSYPIVMSWRPIRPTVVFIGDVAIGLTVYELSDYVNARFDWSESKQYTRQADGHERRDMPIGRLAIRAFAAYRHAAWGERWEEEQRGDLAEQIPAIADLIIRAAPDVVRLAAEGERKHSEWEAQLAAEARERQRDQLAAASKAEAAASREKLTELITVWRRGQDLEAFLDAAAREIEALDLAARVPAEIQLARAREALAPMRAIDVLRAWSPR